MADLEVEVAIAGRAEAQAAAPVVVDGPLRQHRTLAGAVGYIKTLQRHYLPPVVLEVAGRLEPGERTPLFRSAAGSPLVVVPAPAGRAGPPRGPASSAARRRPTSTVAEAAALADAASLSLPRFASRAPQGPAGAAEPLPDRRPRARPAPPPRRRRLLERRSGSPPPRVGRGRC